MSVGFYGQLSPGEFEILLTILLVAGGAFAGWLYRHERWFRNITFPVIQALTGRDPRGEQVNTTKQGHFQETENRLQSIETDVNDIQEQVEELQRRQSRHVERTERYLQVVFEEVEGADPPTISDHWYPEGDDTSRREDDD